MVLTKIDDAMPLIGHIELTNKCNLNCTICANRFMTRQRNDMEWDVYTHIIRKLAGAGVRQIIFNTIGETLLYPRLSEAVAVAKKLGFYTMVSTNGQNLTEDIAASLFKEKCDLLRVSIQGTSEEEYEKIHIGGRFDNLLANVYRLKSLRALYNSKTAVRIRSVLSVEMSDEEIAKFLSFWKEYVDQVEFMPFGNMGGQNGGLAVDDARRVPCATMWRGINILLDGSVSYCPCDFNGQFVVGSLLCSTLEDIWNNQTFTAIRRKHKMLDFQSLPFCDKCSATRKVWYEKKIPSTTKTEDDIMDLYFDNDLRNYNSKA